MKGARGCLIVLGVVITLGIYITILRLTWPVCLPTVLAAAGWFFTGVSKGSFKSAAHELLGPITIGLLFLSPFLGAAIGAGMGALAGRLSDVGINDDFIKQVSSTIHPGESALFLLTRDEVADKVLPELKQYQFEVIQTSLSEENEKQLHEMLGPAVSSLA